MISKVGSSRESNVARKQVQKIYEDGYQPPGHKGTSDPNFVRYLQ